MVAVNVYVPLEARVSLEHYGRIKPENIEGMGPNYFGIDVNEGFFTHKFPEAPTYQVHGHDLTLVLDRESLEVPHDVLYKSGSYHDPSLMPEARFIKESYEEGRFKVFETEDIPGEAEFVNQAILRRVQEYTESANSTERAKKLGFLRSRIDTNISP